MEIDNIFLIIQLLFFLGAVGLVFVNSLTDVILFVKLACIGMAMLIKCVRSIKEINTKRVLQTQLLFFIPYLLTAFQIVFYYQVAQFILSKLQLAISISIIIIQSINYSFLTNKHNIRTIQWVIYSIGIVVIMSLNVKANVYTINEFSQMQGPGNDYLKSFILLTTATIISKGALILNRMQAAWEKSRQLIKQIDKLTEIELGLTDTIRRNL